MTFELPYDAFILHAKHQYHFLFLLLHLFVGFIASHTGLYSLHAASWLRSGSVDCAPCLIGSEISAEAACIFRL